MTQQNTPTVADRQSPTVTPAQQAAAYFRAGRLPIDAPEAVRAEYRRMERRRLAEWEEEL